MGGSQIRPTQKLSVQCVLKTCILADPASISTEEKLLFAGACETGGKNLKCFLPATWKWNANPWKIYQRHWISSKAGWKEKLTMETLLFARGNTKKELLKSLTGSTNILLEQGVVRRSNIFIKILDNLSSNPCF